MQFSSTKTKFNAIFGVSIFTIDTQISCPSELPHRPQTSLNTCYLILFEINPLSLDNINAQDSYLVIAEESQSGTFLFSIISGISGDDYAISFNEDMEIAVCLSFQLVRRCLNYHIGGHDPKFQAESAFDFILKTANTIVEGQGF